MTFSAQAKSADIAQALKRSWRLPRDEALAQVAECFQWLMQQREAALDATAAHALAQAAFQNDVLHGPPELTLQGLARAEAWALAHNQVDVLCHVYCDRGTSLRGDLLLAESVQWLSRAVVLAQQHALLLRECTAWVRLGTRLGEAGVTTDSIQCYHRALQLTAATEAARTGAADPAAHASWLAQHHLAMENLAASYVDAGEHALALAQADAWLQSVQLRSGQAWEPSMRNASDVWVTRARALLGLNRLQEARASAEQGRELALQSGDPQTQCTADLTAGLLEVASGDAETGLDRVYHAVERCRMQLPSVLHQAVRTAAEACERAGQADMARMYLHELYVLKKHVQAQVAHKLQADTAAFYADVRQQEPELIAPGSGAQRAPAGAARQRMEQLNRMVEEHAIAAERLDDTTGKHCYRVGRMAALLGQAVGLDDQACFMLDLAARLHDVGKLAVPESILMKPGLLTAAERDVMHNHTVAGWELLSRSSIPQMRIAQEIARHHHECWDGSGYPDRLAGAQIPISARVSALADVFDALTHRRPYKDAWSVDATMSEITRLKGRQFDPDLTDVFANLVAELRHDHGEDLDDVLSEAAQHSPYVQERQQFEAVLQAQGQTAGVS